MHLPTLLPDSIIAFAAMFMGALSGGVGLITRPLLILLGYSPQIVIGTSRASSILGDLPGVVVLHRNKKSARRTTLFLAIPILIGTILGVFFAITAESDMLRKVIGIIVLMVALFLLLKNKLGEVETKPRFSQHTRTTIAFLGTGSIAFLSTLSGGLGIIYTALYTWLYGKTYISASSMWRVASYIGGFVASIIFIIKGIIDWRLFIVLALGFMLGSYFGTHFGLKKGEKWTKYIVIVVAIASAIKLLWG